MKKRNNSMSVYTCYLNKGYRSVEVLIWTNNRTHLEEEEEEEEGGGRGSWGEGGGGAWSSNTYIYEMSAVGVDVLSHCLWALFYCKLLYKRMVLRHN